MSKQGTAIFRARKRTCKYRVPLLLLLGFLSVLVYFSYSGTSSSSHSSLSVLPVSAREDSFTGSVNQLRTELSQQQRKEESGEKQDLSYAARVLLTQIEKIQSSDCSEGYSISCGHFQEYCGLGCQLHHRAACLMMSYAMGIPLIHDAKRGWPFDSPWESVYEHLGSNCSTNDRTIYVEWRDTHDTPLITFGNGTEIEYALYQGIPVDAALHRIIQQNHPQPFLWFVGQILTYTTRLSDELRPSFERWFQSLEVTRGGPPIGFHVRRTDKVIEAEDSFHNITEYIQPVKEYLRKTKQNVIPHTVYIATDDHRVLEEAQRKYSTRKWRFIGQKMNVTFTDPWERRSPLALVSAVVDLAALSRCEYLVCGLSSNLCRLVFEILNANYPDASARLTSLDEQYRYLLFWHIIPDKLIPVNSPQGVQIISGENNDKQSLTGIAQS